MIVLGIVAGCGGDGDQTGGKPAGPTTCPASQLRFDGVCCPAGTTVDEAQTGCAPVGPPECAANLSSAAHACVPRWCVAWRTLAGEDCEPGSADCLRQGRMCSEQELSAGAGCPAGQWPDADGNCLEAGPHAPGLPAEGTPPALPDLPAIAEPTWCEDPQGNVSACPGNPAGCSPGQAPNDKGACEPAGVAWVCPPGFIAAAGKTASCVPDPKACGSDPFPPDLPPNTLYVDAAAPLGGLGTVDKPFRTLMAGLQAVGNKGTIALAAGKYTGMFKVTNTIHVIGRCPAMVDIDGEKGPGWIAQSKTGVIHFAGVTLRHADYGVAAIGGATATIENSVLQDISVIALSAENPGSTLTVVNSLVTDAGMETTTGGRGLSALSGGTLLAKRVVVQRERGLGGLAAGAGATVQLDEVRVVDTLATNEGKYGRGLEANAGGQLLLNRVAVEGARQFGVRLSGAGAGLDARWLLVKGVEGETASGTYGEGLLVANGAKAKARGLDISQTRETGIRAFEPQTALDLAGVRIADIDGTSGPGEEGWGLAVAKAAKAVVVGLTVNKAHMAGVSVSGKSAKLTASGVLVRNIEVEKASQLGGYGLMIDHGAQAVLDDVRIDHCVQVGLLVSMDAASAQVDHLTVTDTQTSTIGDRNKDEDLFAAGVVVHGSANLDLQHGRISDNDGVGLLTVGAETYGQIQDTVLDHCRSGKFVHTAAGSTAGEGIWAADGSLLDLNRVRVSQCRRNGVVSANAGTRVVARHVLIDDTMPETIENSGGVGVAVLEKAEFVAEGLRIVRARSTGMFIHLEAPRASLLGVRIDDTLARPEDHQFGNALQVSGGAVAAMAGSVVDRSRSHGIIAVDAGSLASVVGTVVSDTMPDLSSLSNGMGVLALNEGEVQMQSCRLLRNHVASFAVLDGVGSMLGSVISETIPADFERAGGKVVLGDGVVAIGKSNLVLKRSISTGNPRAGLLVDGPVFTEVAGCQLSKNLFGAAMQGGAKLDLKGNAIRDNVLQDLRIEGGLQVPKAPTLQDDK